MLHFFRQIRYKLLQQSYNEKPASPLGRYLFYALGEIALVVIGILIALQVNTWTEEKEQRKKERLYLVEIRSNLEADLENVKSTTLFNSSKDSTISACLETILTASSNMDAMVVLTRNMPVLSEFSLFTQNRVAFDNMVSAENIDLITQDSLRLMLSTYYAETNLLNGTQERVKGLTRNFVDNIAPMLMNRENILQILGKESTFISANDLDFRTNRELIGDLFSMQRSLVGHSTELADYKETIEGIIDKIDQTLDIK